MSKRATEFRRCIASAVGQVSAHEHPADGDDTSYVLEKIDLPGLFCCPKHAHFPLPSGPKKVLNFRSVLQLNDITQRAVKFQ